mmetsp:Transcript_15550/g.39718  ORF Transcript_15550/g.39718 Transcript_15550/m.39718 type:complete len:226 (+) Transcript_15550:105-782(+)
MQTLRRLCIPQTALLGLTAPRALPVADMGFSWLHSFRPDGTQVPSSDPERLRSLLSCCTAFSTFLDQLLVHCGYRAEHVFVLGFSQGAMVALRTALTYARHRLGGAIAVSGMLLREDPLCELTAMRSLLADRARVSFTPLLLTHGARDDVIPVSRMRAQLHTLKKAFAAVHDEPLPSEVCVKEYPSKAHTFLSSQEEVRDVLSFLAERMRLRSLELERRPDVVIL